jgi:threonine dehydrogenase-like Zn-dependent dehydrogenase
MPFVGLGAQTLTVDPFSILYKKTTLMGHMGYLSSDFPVLMDLVRTKRINLQPLISDRLGFPDEINRGMNILQSNEGNPRRVATVHE